MKKYGLFFLQSFFFLTVYAMQVNGPDQIYWVVLDNTTKNQTAYMISYNSKPPTLLNNTVLPTTHTGDPILPAIICTETSTESERFMQALLMCDHTEKAVILETYATEEESNQIISKCLEMLNSNNKSFSLEKIRYLKGSCNNIAEHREKELYVVHKQVPSVPTSIQKASPVKQSPYGIYAENIDLNLKKHDFLLQQNNIPVYTLDWSTKEEHSPFWYYTHLAINNLYKKEHSVVFYSTNKRFYIYCNAVHHQMTRKSQPLLEIVAQQMLETTDSVSTVLIHIQKSNSTFLATGSSESNGHKSYMWQQCGISTINSINNLTGAILYIEDKNFNSYTLPTIIQSIVAHDIPLLIICNNFTQMSDFYDVTHTIKKTKEDFEKAKTEENKSNATAIIIPIPEKPVTVIQTVVETKDIGSSDRNKNDTNLSETLTDSAPVQKQTKVDTFKLVREPSSKRSSQQDSPRFFSQFKKPLGACIVLFGGAFMFWIKLHYFQ